MKFLRRDWIRHSKLGKNRKSKQKWKRPTGRDNKMREKRKGYPAVVSVGYRTKKSEREKIEGKNPITVYNLNDLEKVGKNDAVIIGRVGKKKRLELGKKAEEKNLHVQNINVKKLLKEGKKSGGKSNESGK